jgi:hypothetical protein
MGARGLGHALLAMLAVAIVVSLQTVGLSTAGMGVC